MNMTTAEAVRLAQDISNRFEPDWAQKVQTVLCPPSIDLKPVSNVLAFDKSPINLGAQNVYWEASGAFTGEISPAMLKEVDCEFCIIGHSERRAMFGETDEGVNRKAVALIASDIKPIICCGETIECREAGQTGQFVSAQIRAAVEGIEPSDLAGCVIAYEPIWAIGTGHVPTPEAADAVCATIRGVIEDVAGASCAEDIRILYGGSMKPENAALFLPMPNIDGGLIGGAALKAASFIDLIKACL